MPQANEILRAKFPNGSQQALDILKPLCYIDDNFTIRPTSKAAMFYFTDRHFEAIDYLVEEWDYLYEPIK